MFAGKKFRHLVRKGSNLLVIAITIIAKLFVSLKHWKKHTILLPRMYYVEVDTSSRIHPFFPVFCVDCSEPSKPIQCSDGILFEVGGVLLNLSFSDTP